MTTLQPAAALVALVAVVVNGTFVPSALPAVLREGRVIVPLDLVARFVDRIDAAGTERFAVVRGDHACTVRVLPASDPALVALAPLARCLGGDVRWDGRTKTVALTFRTVNVLRTPAPFDPNAPRVAPTTVFTPEPAPPTPRVIATGSPRPRRTPIPAVPSWPLRSPSAAPVPATVPTTPHP